MSFYIMHIVAYLEESKEPGHKPGSYPHPPQDTITDVVPVCPG